jgi:hypothetical protein
MLSDFTVVAATIAETAKMSQKERVLAGYPGGVDETALERAVVFFSGRPFPRRAQRVTGVGWSTSPRSTKCGGSMRGR